MPFWMRGLAAGAGGVIAGIASLVTFYPFHAPVQLGMDGDTPRFTSGFYDGERDGDTTFAWTAGRAVVRLAGLDRRVNWTCEASVRSARPSDRPAPTVMLSADGASASRTLSGAAFTSVSLEVPVRPERDGLTVSLTTSPVFVPGAGDVRELGVQVDTIGCVPASSHVFAPIAARTSAAVAVGAFGLVAGLLGLGTVAVTGTVTIAAAAAAVLLVTGGGAFGAFPERLAWIAGTAALAALALAVLVDGVRTMAGSRASTEDAPSRLPLAWPLLLAAGVYALELSALSHPGKLPIDAVFQAHRLEWVMSGRYLFTQPLPDGVAFPYAIGLYVTAAPFGQLVDDHVLLVRAVALVAQALAGLSLYALLVRERMSTASASVALLLFHAAPLTFVVIGNANLPNVFAQAVGTIAMVGAAVLWRSGGRAPAAAAMTVLIALACLSHVTTLAIQTGMLVLLAGAMFASGQAGGRRSAGALTASLGVALVVSWLSYYQHFPEVYARALSRVSAPAAVDPVAPVRGPDIPAVLVRPLTWPEKLRDAASETLTDVGWPMSIGGLAGVLLIVRRRPWDRLTWTILAWAAAWGGLLLAATLTRVDTAYQRYAAEFIGRINLAGYPAAALLGAIAFGAAWRRDGSLAARVCVTALAGAAAVIAASRWLAWFH